MGAPLANRNGMRHGLRSGQLPRDAKYIEVRICKFRQTLEDAVLDARGEVTILDAVTIQAMLRWERHAALANRWLVKGADKLKPLEKLKFSSEVAKAGSELLKLVRTLNLDQETSLAVLGATLNRPALMNGTDHA